MNILRSPPEEMDENLEVNINEANPIDQLLHS